MLARQQSVAIEMSQVNIHSDRQTDRQIDRQTDRLTDRHCSNLYFHQLETSEDPIRSLKVVEVEKKKEKEKQARNVSKYDNPM